MKDFFFMWVSLESKYCIEHKCAGLLTFKKNCDFFFNVDPNQKPADQDLHFFVPNSEPLFVMKLICRIDW